MRQVGLLAAAARVAIEEHFPLLPATHELAQWLQTELASLGVGITQQVDTNMLFIDTEPLGFSSAELNQRLAALPQPILSWAPRIVVHHQISPEAVKEYVQVVAQMKDEVAQHGKLLEAGDATVSKGAYSK